MDDCFPSREEIENPAKAVEWVRGHCSLPVTAVQSVLRKFADCPVTSIAAIAESLPRKISFKGTTTSEIKGINAVLLETYRRVYQFSDITSTSDEDSWKSLKRSSWDVQKALEEHRKTSPSLVAFPPFMSSTEFVRTEIEGKAPLFGQHTGGWLQANRDALIERVKGWSDAIETIYRAPIVLVPIPSVDFDEEVPRIIINDSIRTFYGPKHQFRLATFLHSLWKECGNYSQSMSYLAGILLLTLNEQEAAGIMRKVNTKYIPGHWAAQAVGFNTNAFVWDALLREVDAELHAHFKAIHFLPDTYLQKIFSALCIHVLAFDVLYDFIEAFLAQGFPFLLQFATALAVYFKPRLLATTKEKINQCFDLMKMDVGTVSKHDYLIVFENAKRMNIEKYIPRIEEWRADAYEKIIAPRLQSASGADTFEPCGICEVEKPDLFCDDCGVLCAKCCETAKAKGSVVSKDKDITHLPSHEVSKW